MSKIIDLGDSREDRKNDLIDLILSHAESQKFSPRRIVELILDETLGNTLIDDELEESLTIGIAQTCGGKTKNPQHDLNGGYDGNSDDDE